MVEKNNDIGLLQIPDSVKIGENAFNAIRLLCCLIVIVGHSFDISHTTFAYRKLIDMPISVCIFFILSGFWVTKSFLTSSTIKDYAIKRIKRLLPPYYLTVFLFAIICVFFSEFSTKEYFTSTHFWKYIFWNSIFLNFICPSLPGVFNEVAINGALWTIKVEIGFYIILPILIYILKKFNSKKKQNIFLSVIYILSVIWNEGLSRLAPVMHIPSQLSYQLPGFMSYFVMGMLFLFNWEYLISKKKFFIIPAVIIFSLHYLTKTEILMPCALTCILMWFGTTLKCFKRIGMPVDYSYGMYLFHFPLNNIYTYYGLFSTSFIGASIAVIGISFIMAFITEKYIQTNINRRKING